MYSNFPVIDVLCLLSCENIYMRNLEYLQVLIFYCFSHRGKRDRKKEKINKGEESLQLHIFEMLHHKVLLDSEILSTSTDNTIHCFFFLLFRVTFKNLASISLIFLFCLHHAIVSKFIINYIKVYNHYIVQLFFWVPRDFFMV